MDFDLVRAKAEGREAVGMDATTTALFPDTFGVSERGELPQVWRASELSAEAEQHGGRIQTGPLVANYMRPITWQKAFLSSCHRIFPTGESLLSALLESKNPMLSDFPSFAINIRTYDAFIRMT